MIPRRIPPQLAYQLQSRAERVQRHAAQAELHQLHAQRAQAELRQLAQSAGLRDGEAVAIDGEPGGLPTGSIYEIATGRPVMEPEPTPQMEPAAPAEES